MSTIAQLPPYPSFRRDDELSPSQRATLTKTISVSLLQTLALPPTKRDTRGSREFVSSYANNTAQKVLESLIWEANDAGSSREDELISKRVFLLAENLSESSIGLDFHTLVDLSIVYSPRNTKRLRALFAKLSTSLSLSAVLETDVVPAYTSRLLDRSGLYVFRKTSHALCCLLQSLPNDLLCQFFRSKVFMLALARAYDHGLGAIAHSYGGLNLDATQEQDDWARIWLQSKVALMDSFHVLLSAMLKDITSSHGPALAHVSERAFDVIFALLDLSPSTSEPSRVSFLDRPLLADYQHAYNLADTLGKVLKAGADDPRVDLLDATLRTFDEGTEGQKSPGALKLLLSSSGVPPGVDHRGNSKGKGKMIASTQDYATESDPDLDVQISSVLDILPDESPSYIRVLLLHPLYSRNPESVISALLEGTAPKEDELTTPHVEPSPEFKYTLNRRNIFDDEVIDISTLRRGKKNEDVMRDRTFIEEMKADILRRAEEMQMEDEEDEAGGGKVGFEDDFDDVEGSVKVIGDGEASGGEDGDDDEEGDKNAEKPPQDRSPETILELAYIRDPSLFNRDAQTRRSKQRAELISQSGWSNEQIEGWRIMLERDPKKDKILQKHEFAGNRSTPSSDPATMPGGGDAHVGAGSERGRGQQRGRGRGRGGEGGGAGRGSGSEAKDRAWKDKNKASRGNHNRKRGHDRKMARGAALPGT